MAKVGSPSKLTGQMTSQVPTQHPNQLSSVLWRRPQSAPNEKLKKIVLVLQGPMLPSGRARVTVYPNRYQTVPELMEVVSRELTRADGSPLHLHPGLVQFRLLNGATGKFDPIEDTTAVRDLCRIKIVPLGSDVEDDYIGEDNDIDDPQDSAVAAAAAAGGRGELALHSVKARPISAGSTRLGAARSARGRPASAATTRTRLGHSMEQSFKVGDLTSDLLVYHTKLVTYLSTKVSIECEVTSKDLAQMEIMYEDQAFKLMSQLEAVEPMRAMRILTQLGIQTGKSERGFAEEETLAGLRHELHNEKSRSTKLQRDLSVCQEEIEVLRGKVDAMGAEYERRRVSHDAEVEAHRLDSQRLVKEVSRLQRLVDSLRAENRQVGAAADAGRGRFNSQSVVAPSGPRPSTAPAPSPHGIVAERKGAPKGMKLENSLMLNQTIGSGGSGGGIVSISPSNMASDRTAHQSPNHVRMMQTQFVTLQGENHSKQVAVNADACSSAVAFLDHFQKEFIGVLRAAATAQGLPRKQVFQITIPAVSMRTVHNSKMVELETDETIDAFVKTFDQQKTVSLICLERKAPKFAGFSLPTPLSISGTPEIRSPIADEEQTSKRTSLIKAALSRNNSSGARGTTGAEMRRLSTHASLRMAVSPTHAMSPRSAQRFSSASREEPTPMFSAESLRSVAKRDGAVMRETFNQLGGDHEGIGIPTVLKYLKKHFDDFGDSTRFERVAVSCMNQGAPTQKTTIADLALSTVSFDVFCMILLQVARS